MSFDDLLVRARAAAAAPNGDEAAHGFTRLSGGMSHDVLAPVDHLDLVVKVFQATAQREAGQEWDSLVSLATSGLAPEPVHFDATARAVLVMSRAPGVALPAARLTSEHALAIGEVHRKVHLARPPIPAPPMHAALEALRASLLADGSLVARSDAPENVVQAWRSAQSWVAGVRLEDVTPPSEVLFSRGDPNLSNYLWSDGGVVLVDWENSGYNDPAVELADMAEHASTRELSEQFWREVGDAVGLGDDDWPRVTQARRAVASFWLILIESRHRQGLPTTVTLEEQALRTIATLGG